MEKNVKQLELKKHKTRMIWTGVLIVVVVLGWIGQEDPAINYAAFSFTPLPLIPLVAVVVFTHSTLTYITLKSNDKLSFADQQLTWWQILIGLLFIIVMLNFLNTFAN